MWNIMNKIAIKLKIIIKTILSVLDHGIFCGTSVCQYYIDDVIIDYEE